MKPALHVLLLNRSLFSNFSIDNILSERLAEEENVKIVDVNVLTKIKQEKIELLGESLLLKYKSSSPECLSFKITLILLDSFHKYVTNKRQKCKEQLLEA